MLWIAPEVSCAKMVTVFVPVRRCRTVIFQGVVASRAPKSHILLVWSRTSYQIGPAGVPLKMPPRLVVSVLTAKLAFVNCTRGFFCPTTNDTTCGTLVSMVNAAADNGATVTPLLTRLPVL